MKRHLLRFVALWAVVAGVELLERVAYAAGVDDTYDGYAEAYGAGVDAMTHAMVGDVDDDLAAADVSDVVLVHVQTFHGPDAPRAGECAC